jgi:hypothetical protein
MYQNSRPFSNYYYFCFVLDNSTYFKSGVVPCIAPLTSRIVLQKSWFISILNNFFQAPWYPIFTIIFIRYSNRRFVDFIRSFHFGHLVFHWLSETWSSKRRAGSRTSSTVSTKMIHPVSFNVLRTLIFFSLMFKSWMLYAQKEASHRLFQIIVKLFKH